MDFKPIELNDIRASPLLAPEHTNLPPALVQVCGMDPLRDEGILYEKLLRESGVQTKLHTYVDAAFFFSLARTYLVAYDCLLFTLGIRGCRTHSITVRFLVLVPKPV